MFDSEEPFELKKLLGTGGFAQTWLAKILDPELIEEWNRDVVALKIPLSKQKARVLQRELQLTGSLHLQLTSVESTNIVKYFGFEIFDGKPVMAMELIKDGSLRELIGKIGYRKKISLSKALQLIKGILMGLDVIHKKHIVHRDIKPDNILLDGEIPKISDLGISRMLGPEEMASTVIGTIFYMPPELLYGKSATYNVDFWSLGVTFYELLSGEFPFGIKPNMPPGKVMNAITDKNVSLTFPENENFPQGIKNILNKMLQKDPEKRYKIAEEILKDIKEYDSPITEVLVISKNIDLVRDLLLDMENKLEAEKKLKELIIMHPDSFEVFLFSGEFYNKQGKYNTAIDMFNKGLKLAPDNALIVWGLAIAQQNIREYKKACLSLEKAIDLGLEKSLERLAKILLKNLSKKK